MDHLILLPGNNEDALQAHITKVCCLPVEARMQLAYASRNFSGAMM
jgi:hypothetical protein